MGYFNYICQFSVYCFLVPNLPSYSICLSGALRVSSLQASAVLNCATRGCWSDTAEEGASLPGSAVIVVSCSCSEILGHQNGVLCSSCAPSVRSLPLWAQSPCSDSCRSSCGSPGTNTVGSRPHPCLPTGPPWES